MNENRVAGSLPSLFELKVPVYRVRDTQRSLNAINRGRIWNNSNSGIVCLCLRSYEMLQTSQASKCFYFKFSHLGVNDSWRNWHFHTWTRRLCSNDVRSLMLQRLLGAGLIPQCEENSQSHDVSCVTCRCLADGPLPSKVAPTTIDSWNISCCTSSCARCFTWRLLIASHRNCQSPFGVGNSVRVHGRSALATSVSGAGSPATNTSEEIKANRPWIMPYICTFVGITPCAKWLLRLDFSGPQFFSSIWAAGMLRPGVVEFMECEDVWSWEFGVWWAGMYRRVRRCLRLRPIGSFTSRQSLWTFEATYQKKDTVAMNARD